LKQRVSPEFISTQSGSTVTKDELRAELERQEQRYKDVYGGEVTTYAAQPEPERKPWRKRATVQDQAFTQELQKMEKELKAEEPWPPRPESFKGLRLHPLKARCFDVAFRARYQRAAATSPSGWGKWRMSDPLLRNFIQPSAPLAPTRETRVPVGFSKKINELQNPVKTSGLGLCDKLIRWRMLPMSS
jgi:hypothetical protein